MKYLWQNPNWPNFKWNSESLMNPLLDLNKNRGILEGQMKSVGFEVQADSQIERFTQEIKNSFEIEGVKLDEHSLRSSVTRQLGFENIILAQGKKLDSIRPKIDSIVEVITDAVHNCNEPLTEERLFEWHRKLFGNPDGNFSFNGLYKISIGNYRTDEDGPMRVVSGFGKNETVHFEAPGAELLPEMMNQFFEWFNNENSINSVIKSAVAHLYFVELHPFEDGNGRLARAISDMALCRNSSTENISNRYDHLFSMSSQLCKVRKEYYAQLQAVEKTESMDITEWILWYINCMNDAIISVLKELDEGQKRKVFWEKIEKFDINERQRKILDLLLKDFEGNLTSSKYAKICNCSQDTASRDIEKLINLNILAKGTSGGRSTNYVLID